jgi:hypothetical protein
MRVFRRSHRVSGALVVLAALNAVPAAAQQAEANLLFDEGRAAMAKRDHAQAITKLEQSQRLDAAVGTLLNLGECYAALGRSASAWVTYREAASLASSMKQRDRERFASRKAQELEPRLSHLELVVAPEARPPGLVITRGAISIPEGLWGSSIPVDPGVQHLEAKAPGRATWTLDVNVGESADKVRVEVPVLELAASPSPSPPPAPPASPSAPLAPPVTASPAFPTTLPAIDHSADERPRSSLPTIGWVSVTAGGVAALTGVLVFVNGRSQIDDANCPNEVCVRGVGDKSLHDDGRRSEKLGVGLGIIGVAAAAVGVVLVASGSSGDAHASRSPGRHFSLQLAAAPTSVGLRGAW